MSYIPHAALGATKMLNGSISKAIVIENTSTKGLKYQIQCEVTIFGIPGNRTLRNVRFFGSITYSIGSDTRTSVPGFYDPIIEWAIQKDEKLEDVVAKITDQLSGTAVTAQNLGGRWLIR